MTDTLPPFLVYLIGAALIPLLPNGRVRACFLPLIPLAGLAALWTLPDGAFAQFTLAGHDITLLRVDRLSRLFAIIFSLAGFLSLLFAWHVRDPVQQIAAVLYAGAAIGAVLAGDLLTLFIFWEATALTSVFLIWARRTPGALHTGMRYLIVQIGSGVLLLAGIILHVRAGGGLAFDYIGLNAPGGWLILLAFGIKCAFPLLHNWLQDAYPAATPTGSVILSAFTTKLAVYALARAFPGTEALVYVGAIMSLFPIFYAVIENDLRRVLAYSLNNQLGFMVVGIGIGTPLALNGTAAHAFCHILYKALLFMSMGAVLFRTGTAKGSELGGLYKSMPITMICCVVGAASISAFPLFSGFVSKSLILSATADNGYLAVWLALLFASAGVFHHSGIKIPYFAFFAHDPGWRVREAPWNMLAAMILTAALCIGIGVFPGPLYAILPFPLDYAPYTASHVISQLQLLLFSALAFAVLMRTGIYPPELRSINLDSDWLYRRLLPGLFQRSGAVLTLAQVRLSAALDSIRQAADSFLRRTAGPLGLLTRAAPAGSIVLWTMLLLTASLLIGTLR